MYYSAYGLITGIFTTYLIAKVTDMDMKSSGGYLQLPGGGQFLVFFGGMIGTAVGLGIDIGHFMNN